MKHKKTRIALFLLLTVVGIFLFVQYKKVLNFGIKFKSINFDVLGMRQTKGTLKLKFFNPSVFNVFVDSCDIKVYINNVFINNAAIKETTEIKSKEEVILNVYFDLEPHRVLSIKNINGLSTILNPQNTKLGFKGNIKIRKGIFKFNVPININEPISYFTEDKKK